MTYFAEKVVHGETWSDGLPISSPQLKRPTLTTLLPSTLLTKFQLPQVEITNNTELLINGGGGSTCSWAENSVHGVGMSDHSHCYLHYCHRWTPFPQRTPHPIPVLQVFDQCSDDDPNFSFVIFDAGLTYFLNRNAACNAFQKVQLVSGCMTSNGMDYLQGIKLDSFRDLDNFTYMFRKHYYMWLHCSAVSKVVSARIATRSYLLCLAKKKEKGLTESHFVFRDGTESKGFLSIVSARLLFTALGCVMLGTLIYTIATDGSPFRRDVLTPWMSATLIDFYVNVFTLSVWVAYKESNWKTAALWIILLICFGSISTCAYIVLQLFHLSSGDPVFLVLFSSNSRQVCNYDGNSIAQTLLVY
ncbi:UNVERIFIED_CONTAM: hypothetical protein Slati_2517100 [Sesamum latifolium]|uniref:Uncharacterized protein n=1 Tax=Sesamum latifolium TaxID=2727402 RepID=A0AAW2WI47_9LAMI